MTIKWITLLYNIKNSHFHRSDVLPRLEKQLSGICSDDFTEGQVYSSTEIKCTLSKKANNKTEG